MQRKRPNRGNSVGRHFIYLFIMKFVQLGTQIKTRCEKKKLYKNTQKVHYAFIEKNEPTNVKALVRALTDFASIWEIVTI